MFKYEESPRCKAFEALQLLLNQAQVELGERVWEGDIHQRIERAAELRHQLFDATLAYAQAREEEKALWLSL